MSAAEAKRANVDSTRRIIALASHTPGLRRLVAVSGYRVGSLSPTDDLYSRLGAYESSRVEADVLLRTEADRLEVPWTVKPSRRARLVDALDRFGGPLHIITGETDPPADWAAARFPAARFSVVPGTGHNPQLTHAVELAELIGT